MQMMGVLGENNGQVKKRARGGRWTEEENKVWHGDCAKDRCGEEKGTQTTRLPSWDHPQTRLQMRPGGCSPGLQRMPSPVLAWLQEKAETQRSSVSVKAGNQR